MKPPNHLGVEREFRLRDLNTKTARAQLCFACLATGYAASYSARGRSLFLTADAARDGDGYSMKPTINEARTDIAKRRVCVRKDSFAFPPTCLLCNASPATATPVEYKAVLLAGVIAGGETTILDIPLCESCARAYLRAKWRTNAWMTVCFVLGFGTICFGQMLAELAPRKLNLIPNVIGIAAEVMAPVLILTSFFLLLTKNRNFPVKLKHRGWIFRDDVHHVFIFPDEEMMKRFLAANVDRTATVSA